MPSFNDSENLEIDYEKRMNEYNDLKDLVITPDNNDVYNNLMNKETYVLDTVNNLINNEKKKKETKKQFYNLSLKELTIKLLKTIIDIINEISIILVDPLNKNNNILYTLMKCRKTFTKRDRIIYVGIILIIISILIYFIDITE